MNVATIARIAHEVNRAYCASIGDHSQPAWEDAPEWQRNSAVAGVTAHLANDLTPEQSHESWLAVKMVDGWKYGPAKDAEKKEHPCFCPYADLPAEQRAKDYLFRGVVHAFKPIEPLPDKVTLEALNTKVVSEQYIVPAGTTLTICILTMQNGFTVTGESACVVPANFNAELGKKYARERAINSAWTLEGYLLQQGKHDAGK
jgi:hypothetical protein